MELTTDERAIRLRCLELALAAHGNDFDEALPAARRMVAFIDGANGAAYGESLSSQLRQIHGTKD